MSVAARAIYSSVGSLYTQVGNFQPLYGPSHVCQATSAVDGSVVTGFLPRRDGRYILYT